MIEFNKENEYKIIFEDENIMFDPLNPNDVEKIKNNPFDLEGIKFDIFNSDLKDPKLFGQLDIFFTEIGIWRFIDWRSKDGKSYIRADIAPIFADPNMSKEDLVLAIIEHVKNLHIENKAEDLEFWNSKNWKEVDDSLKVREKVKLQIERN